MTAGVVLRRLAALVAVVVLTAFAFLLVTGEYSADGPVLFTLAGSHGLHRGDVVVLTGWAAGVLSVAWLVLSGRR